MTYGLKNKNSIAADGTDVKFPVGQVAGRYVPIGGGTVFDKRKNTSVSNDTGVSLPRAGTDVTKEELGRENELGGELIVTSFNKFIKEQYNTITAIDDDETQGGDAFTKRKSYISAMSQAADKIGMYRRIFNGSGKTLDSETASEGLRLLTELEDVYKERMKATVMPKEYLASVKAGSASPASDYLEKTEGKGANPWQLSAVLKDYNRETGTDALRAEVSTAEYRKQEADKLLQRIEEQKKRLLLSDKYSDYIDKEAVASDIAKLEAEYREKYSDVKSESEIAAMRQALRESKTADTADRYKAYTEREDFEEYARIGAEMGNPDIDTVAITNRNIQRLNNKVAFAKENADELMMRQYTYPSEDEKNIFKLAYVKEDEEKIYNYILGKYGTKEADRYLDSLEYTLNDRIAGKRAEMVEGAKNPVERLALYGLEAKNSGIEQIRGEAQGVLRFKTGDTSDVIPSVDRLTSEKLRENMTGLGAVAFDLTSNIVHMVPSILAGFVSPVLSGAVTGIGAAGGGYNDMIDLGYDAGQARAYGVMTGASEALMQYFFSGISAMGGIATGHALEKAVSQVDNAIGKIAIQFGGSFASEALEEGAQEMLEPVFRAIATGDNIEGIDWEAVAYAALLGGLSAGVLEGIPSSVKTVAKAIKTKGSYSEVQSELVAEGLESAEGTLSRQLADKYQKILDDGGDLTGTQLATLIEANDEAIAREEGVEEREYGIDEKGQRKYLFGGEKSKTANIAKLNEAKYRIAVGDAPETVRQETGWYQGYDGKWKYEIDDSNAVFRSEGDVNLMKDESYKRLQELTDKWADGNISDTEYDEMEWLEEQFQDRVWEEKYRLDDYLDHPDLYEAYPILRTATLIFDDLPSGNNGYYNPKSNTIVLSRNIIGDKKKTLIHEIQHIIQRYEGFAKGANPEYWKSVLQNGSVIDSVKYRETLKELENISDKDMYKKIVDLYYSKPTIPRGKIDLDNFVRVAEDPEEWVAYDEKRAALEEEYGFNNVMDTLEKIRRFNDTIKNDLTAEQLYSLTAGEIEARDAASRADYTPEQRKNIRPDIDRSDVVFADGNVSYFSSSSNKATAKTESKVVLRILEENIEKIPNTNVFQLESDGIVTEPKKSDYVNNVFVSQGGYATNKSLGRVELTNKGAKSTIFHGYGKNKLIAVEAIKATIEDGVIVSVINNYEGKGIDRYIIAAKGKINKADSYMAVVVEGYPMNGGHKQFYLHEVLTKETASHIMTATQKNADTVSETVSDISISHPDGIVNIPYYTDSEVSSPEERVQETRLSAEENDIPAEDIAAFERVAEEFGVSVLFYDGDPDVEGDGYYENGTIHLNRNARDPIAVVFSHELSHASERAGYYKQLQSLALREMQRITGKDISALRNEAMDEYSRHGVTLDEPGADAEIVAKFVQEHVLGNTEELGRLCEENPSLMQRILDYFTEFLERIGIRSQDTERIDRARRTLAGALREAGGADTVGNVAKYSFSSRAGSIDAEAIAEAERMESEGYTEKEIYDAVGLWRDIDSEEKYWKKDTEADGIAKYRDSLEYEVNDGRKNSIVADPYLFDAEIAEAERMEAEGRESDYIYDELGLWRNRSTGEWMTRRNNEPGRAPHIRRMSLEEYAAKSKSFQEDVVDVYRLAFYDMNEAKTAAEEERKYLESDNTGIENGKLSAVEDSRQALEEYHMGGNNKNDAVSEVSSARGDIVLDSLEEITGEKISGELENEIYDMTEALTEAEADRKYLEGANAGIENGKLSAAEESRQALEEYHMGGNNGEITEEDEAFAFDGGENLTEDVFNALMAEDKKSRDELISYILEARGKLGEISESERAGIDALAQDMEALVKEYGIIEERQKEIADNAGAIVRGKYPLSESAQDVYDILVRRDTNDSSFAADIERCEEKLLYLRDELNTLRRNGSEHEDVAAGIEEQIARLESKLDEYRADRERMWNEFMDEVALSDEKDIEDALFYFEHGTLAQSFAADILAATDSFTAESDRDDIGERLLFIKSEIEKRELVMDADSIEAAKRLSYIGYIESNNDDVQFLADLYTTQRCLASGNHSAALVNLGVRIDTPITMQYGNASLYRTSVIRRDRLEKLAKKKARSLKPEERVIAKEIAEGLRGKYDIPKKYDAGRILAFSDIWRQYKNECEATKNIQKFRAKTAEEYTDKIGKVIGSSPVMKLKQIVLSMLTPERVMRYAFGDKLGAELSDELISPIHTNEAERTRFVNRLINAVYLRFGEVSKEESAHAQMLGESGASIDYYDKILQAANERGIQYDEYAAERKGRFDSAVSELAHRELVGYLTELGYSKADDKFYDALAEKIAAEYETDIVAKRNEELLEIARIKHKSKTEKISDSDMKKIREEAKLRAKDEVERLRENEAAYKPAEHSEMSDAELEKIANEASPDEMIEAVRKQLAEKAEKNIRRGDTSEEAIQSRESWVEEQLRRRLAIADHIRGQYNMLFDGINDMLVTHGYEPVPFRRNYFPHMQADNMSTVSKILSSFGFQPNITELPAQIAGRTDVFKPGHRWAPFMQHRSGGSGNFEYDAIEGFSKYLYYASDIIYHMDDIQKLRAFSNSIRMRHSTDEIKSKIESLRDDFYEGKITKEELDEEREKLLEKAEMTGDAGKFATWLDDYTNILAGKQSFFDRSLEHLLGRSSLNKAGALQNIFARSAIVGNISSALMNTSQIPMAAAMVGARNIKLALADMASGRLNELYDFDGKSDFLTGKRGIIDKVSEKKITDRVLDGMSVPFELTDDFSVMLIQRGFYFKLVESGMSVDEAIKRSDRMTQAIMGGRTKGAKPLIFESKNFIMKLVTMFQLEVSNALQFTVNDLKFETKRIYGGDDDKWKLMLAGEIAKYFVLAFLYNLGLEQLIGYKALPIDVIGMTGNAVAHIYGTSQKAVVDSIINGVGSAEDLEFKGKEGFIDAAKVTAGDILDDVPFVSNIIQALGWKEGRMPIYDITPLRDKVWAGFEKAVTSEKSEDKKAGLVTAGEGLIDLAKGFVPGGNQINKTIRGIKAVTDEGVYNSKGELKYPVEKNAGNTIKGALFGPASLQATDDFYESGGRAYSKTETGLIDELIGTGISMGEASGMIDDLNKIGKKKKQSKEEYEFTGNVYDKLDEILFADDEDEDELTSKQEKVLAMQDYGLTREQNYLLYRDMIASEKERVLLEAIDYTGGDTVEAAHVMSKMCLAEDKREKLSIMTADSRLDEAELDKLNLVMDSGLDDTDAAILFYGMIAGEEDRKVFDILREVYMEKSEDIFVTLAEQKRITLVPDNVWKKENDITKGTARYNKLMQSPISEASKSGYYTEKMITDDSNEDLAFEYLRKNDSDITKLYKVIGDAKYTTEDKKGKYGVLIDADITGDEQYIILKYYMTNEDDREKLDENIEKVVSAGGTIDDYLAAKEATDGIKAEKDSAGKAIKNTKSPKLIRAIRDALPDAEPRVLAALFEVCGVGKSYYQNKNTTGKLGVGGFKKTSLKNNATLNTKKTLGVGGFK